MQEICKIHDKEVGKIDTLILNVESLIADVKWIKRFGVWSISVVGGSIVLIIPFLVAFAVYVHSLDTRLSVVEQIIKDHTSSTTTTTEKK